MLHILNAKSAKYIFVLSTQIFPTLNAKNKYLHKLYIVGKVGTFVS